MANDDLKSADLTPKEILREIKRRTKTTFFIRFTTEGITERLPDNQYRYVELSDHVEIPKKRVIKFIRRQIETAQRRKELHDQVIKIRVSRSNHCYFI